MNQIKIRSAKPKDRTRAVYVEGQSTPGLHYLDRMYDEWLGDKEGKLLVAEKEGEIVGVGKFSVLPDRTAWLETLRVLPNHQGSGVGKEFYRKFLQLAGEKNIHTIRMYTGLSNFASKGLAKRYGFRLAGTFRGSTLAVTKVIERRGCEEFVPLTDPERAAALLSHCENNWSNFGIMNRTFYRLSPALWKNWSDHGMIFEQQTTGTMIVLGTRFMPEQALHIAVFAGDAEAALKFAQQKAYLLGNDLLKCMFPEESEEIRTTLQKNGFILEDSCCIVMECNL